MWDACLEMLHLTDTSAHANFISSVHSRILCIFGQTTAELNCTPTSTTITVLATYPE